MHNSYMNTLLKQLRIQSNRTLRKVADSIGIHPAHLSRVERGQLQASPDLAEKLANYFDRAITEEQILYPSRFSGRRANVKDRRHPKDAA